MSDQSEFNRQLANNKVAYESMRGDIQSKYVGQYVGIAFGKIVAVDPDYFKVCSVVDRLEPRAIHHLVFLGEDDPGFEPVECGEDKGDIQLYMGGKRQNSVGSGSENKA